MYVCDISNDFIYYCKVESLLVNCTPTGEDQLWKTIPLPPCANRLFVMLSFEQHLLVVCEGLTYVYSPNTPSWVFMDDNLLTEYPHLHNNTGSRRPTNDDRA